ncbi:MAG: hypothetical protein ACFCD0_15900 [Gemmataceae bacterium]
MPKMVCPKCENLFNVEPGEEVPTVCPDCAAKTVQPKPPIPEDDQASDLDELSLPDDVGLVDLDAEPWNETDFAAPRNPPSSGQQPLQDEPDGPLTPTRSRGSSSALMDRGSIKPVPNTPRRPAPSDAPKAKANVDDLGMELEADWLDDPSQQKPKQQKPKKQKKRKSPPLRSKDDAEAIAEEALLGDHFDPPEPIDDLEEAPEDWEQLDSPDGEPRSNYGMGEELPLRSLRRKLVPCRLCDSLIPQRDEFCRICGTRQEDFDAEEEIRRRWDRKQMDDHRGETILWLGLVSLLFWPLGPFVWSMGEHDLNLMEREKMDPEGRERTQNGVYCGIASTLIMALTLGILILVVYPILVGGL